MIKTSRMGSTLFLAALIAPILLYPSLSPASDIEAPYRVEKFTKTSVTVDFGAAAPSSKREQFNHMTLLTTSGPEPVSLKDLNEECTYLCGEPSGEEGEEVIGPTCHFVGLYTRFENSDGGKPLAALPGQVKIADWALVKSTGPETTVEIERWISDGYMKPVGGFVDDYRWGIDERTGKVVMMSRGMGPDFYAPPIALDSCQLIKYQGLLRLKCGYTADALYSDSRELLVLSLGDYGEAQAEPAARFDTADAHHILVRIGLKSQTVFGILTRSSGQWKFFLRPADYALLC